MIVIFSFLLVLLAANADGAKEGESCTKAGVAGVCANIRHCPDAQQDIRNRKPPQLCEFGGIDPTVCCISLVTTTTTTTTTTRPQTGNCILPPYPDYGTYVTNIPNGRPGDAFDIIAVNTTCRRGYELDGPRTVFCQNGWWPVPMPNCVPACRLLPHHTVIYDCVYSDGRVNGTRLCNEFEPHGTVVSPRCRAPDYYSLTALRPMHCVDGLWDYVAKCNPECGTVTTDNMQLTVGSAAVKHGEVPWHVGVYNKKDTVPPRHFCGGSLVSNKAFISAAHCFWTPHDTKQPVSDFAAAAGKLYNEWNHNMDDEWAQKSDIQEIHIPARFQGERANYQDDIAVLIVSQPFELKAHVRPVCVDFDIMEEKRQLQPGKKGKVAGWGLSGEEGEPSVVLKVMLAPFIDIDTCIMESPPSFRDYITSDKMCAGAKDGSVPLCRGDSGGGLAFLDSEGTQRYFLRGVMSTGPRDEHRCNVHAYIGFTQVSKHKHFVKEYADLPK